MSNNYQLAMDSPAIDAGASLDAPNADFIGTMRPLDGNNAGMFQYDIGAFEAIPVPEPAIGMPLAIALALLFSRSRSKTRGRDHSAKV